MADIERIEYVRVVDYGLPQENDISKDITGSENAR
jgi:hypothetical protein